MSRVASFHLLAGPGPWRAAWRLGPGRRALRGVPGLRFHRVLGTGRGSSTAMGADLSRTALFAVWESADAQAAFAATELARHARGAETWSATLALRSGHGRWGGVDVLDGLTRASNRDGPVAVLTRATVRVPVWRRFAAAGPPVADAVTDAPGLLAVVGIGEAPVGRQATFSLWRDTAAMRAFARHPAHRDVVTRTRAERWYGEELFARFTPTAHHGTWDGRDPLAPPA